MSCHHVCSKSTDVIAMVCVDCGEILRVVNHPEIAALRAELAQAKGENERLKGLRAGLRAQAMGLNDRVKELEAAVAPFSEAYGGAESRDDDDFADAPLIKVGDLRRARAALGSEK